MKGDPIRSRISGKPLRGAIFDLGNVLIQLRPIEGLLGKDGFPGSSGRLSPGRPPQGGGGGDGFDPILRLRMDPTVDLFERGRAGEGEFFDAVRRAFRTDFRDEEIRAVYEGILGDPMPGMEELIVELRSRGVRVIGLSDISPGHLAMIGRYPAVRALERVVASCETSHRKPEPEAYRAALGFLGMDPQETFFTDDQPANIEGARCIGLQAVLFEGAAALRSWLGL